MKLWKFLLLMLGLLALCGVGVLGVNFLVLPSVIHGNKVVTMPDVRGMSATGAGTQLHLLGLEVEVARQRAAELSQTVAELEAERGQPDRCCCCGERSGSGDPWRRAGLV